MPLRLFNTLTKTKEDFAPLDPANVRMYVCGPTVYDFAHIGNARPVIVFDVLFRLLRHIYGDAHVTYVRNITDVDDKINARAAERGISIRELTAETARIYEEDVAALGNLPPSVSPRATEHIAQMIALIQKLIAAGHAYEAQSHVLFDVASKPDYGKLSNRSVKDMVAGARVEVAPYKKDPMDFVLWKPSDDGAPGWDSPWGRGRPGWHIECSAMAGEYLGETFDIHGGGIDLQFPHHENEIAQSEGAHHGAALARVWMHNGFLQVEGEKMAKSAGNFVTIRDLLRDWNGRAWPGSAIRWAMLQTHYRQPIDWTFRLLAESATEIQEILNIFRGRHRDQGTGKVNLDELLSIVRDSKPSTEVISALSDDLEMAEVARIIRALKKRGDTISIDTAVRNLSFLGVLREDDVRYFSTNHVTSSDIENPDKVLRLATNYQVARANNDSTFASSIASQFHEQGLFITERETSMLVITSEGGQALFDESIQKQVDAWTAARAAKDFAKSDSIRVALMEQGLVQKNGPNGPTWGFK